MIARVVPAIRTPRHVDVFDYEIPKNLSVFKGDIVRIPFRSRTIPGLVISIEKTAGTNRPLKPIQSTVGIRVTKETIALLSALSDRAFCSQPTVLHAWLGTLPKKLQEEPSAPREKQTTSINEVKRIHNHIFGENGIVETVKNLLEKNTNILIISPWASRAKSIAEALEVKAFTGTSAMGERFRIWSSFIRGEKRVLVTTRIGAWCATEADVVILDEPENDDHKQDELAPRYDARWISAFANANSTGLVRIGLTPRLAEIASEKDAEDIPTIEATITRVDTHGRDWSDMPGIQGRTLIKIEEALEEQRAIFVIHAIHGTQARMRCADCGWEATCASCGAGTTLDASILHCKRCGSKTPAILSCPSCSGSDFSKSKPGRVRLDAYCRAHELQNISILSIGEWNDVEQLPEGALVVVTDLHLLIGGGEDIRRKERLIVAWRRLVDRVASTKDAEVVVQGNPDTLSQSIRWTESDGCREALTKELKERRAFELPPETRLIKLIFRGNSGHAERMIQSVQNQFRNEPALRIAGPFEVLYRPNHRIPRHIGHIVTPLDFPLQKIREGLKPILETDTIIDLDPIAFFE